MLADCVRYESCREILAPISPNGSIIQDAPVKPAHRCTLRDFLSKALINKYKYVSQKATLHRPNSLTKALDGLFKYVGNRVWFARALGYWDHLETARHRRKIACHT